MYLVNTRVKHVHQLITVLLAKTILKIGKVIVTVKMGFIILLKKNYANLAFYLVEIVVRRLNV